MEGVYIGLARSVYIFAVHDRKESLEECSIYTVHIQGWPEPCIYGIFGRELNIYTAIYAACIRFRPSLYTYLYGSGLPWLNI